jgi:ParB-like chromosome segregation protein Spo0J
MPAAAACAACSSSPTTRRSRTIISVDCILREIADLDITTESLHENLIRKDLRPYEVFAAYAKAHAGGATVADLAEEFGQRPLYVEQVLRLGHLHPEIFAAYSRGELSDDQARAYAATEDQALQLAIWKRLAKLPNQWDRNAPQIRAAMKVGDRDAARLLSFVGLETYEAAGGRWERDLFEEAEQRGRIVDEQLLARLVEEKRGALIAGVIDRANRDVHWSDKPPQTGGTYAYTDATLRIDARKAPLSAETRARKEELEQMKLDIEDTARRSLHDKKGNRKPGMEAEEAALDAEYQPVVDELAAIEDARRWILPKGGEVVFTVDIGPAGDPDISFWWASRKAQKDAEKARAAATAKAGPGSTVLDEDGFTEADKAPAPAAPQADLTSAGMIVMAVTQNESRAPRPLSRHLGDPAPVDGDLRSPGEGGRRRAALADRPMTWGHRARTMIEMVMEAMPAEASIDDRRRELRRCASAFHGGTSWGQKIWSRECRRYLAPIETAAGARLLSQLPDDIIFPFRGVS